MYRASLLVSSMLCISLAASTASAQSANGAAGPPRSADALAPAASGAPSNAGARKTFAKAMKALEEHKFTLALDSFRKADDQDGGHCVPCEYQAYKAAKQLQDYTAAHAETALLLDHVTNAGEKAEVHLLTGDLSLSEGGYRIFEKPFRDADSEFKLALDLKPGNADCLYNDGLALAHLHQYEPERERFEQFMKAASPKDFRYARARLFTVQPELARKRTAPNFNVVALDGKTLSMDNLAGKVVLIDFWATWCGPCMKALPHLREIAQKFEGQPLVILSINLDEDEAAWKNFVAKNAMTWAQYRDGSFDGPMATQFNVKAIPTTFSIDADGFVQDRQVGDGDIEDTLKKLVAQAKEAVKSKALAQVQ
jgi:thiol-disulfide isomerase/thioredoxin